MISTTPVPRQLAPARPLHFQARYKLSSEDTNNVIGAAVMAGSLTSYAGLSAVASASTYPAPTLQSSPAFILPTFQLILGSFWGGEAYRILSRNKVPEIPR